MVSVGVIDSIKVMLVVIKRTVKLTCQVITTERFIVVDRNKCVKF